MRTGRKANQVVRMIITTVECYGLILMDNGTIMNVFIPVNSVTPIFCLQTGNDGRFTSQCLFNHVTKEQAGNGIVSCGKACRSDPRCRSFNLLEQEGGKMVCQLNNATRHEAAEGEMKEEENCYFFDL